MEDYALKEYTIKKSFMYNQKLKSYLPGGVYSNFYHDTSHRLHFTEAKGSRCIDMDGNEYIDLYNKSGSVFLGHGHPDFIRSIQECIGKNLVSGWPELELETFQCVSEAIPCCEQMRFGLSGSEMVANALRLAMAYTGREKIIRFRGHYHGSSDYMMPDNIANHMHVIAQQTVIELPWNNVEAIEKCLEKNDIAAVIMEPLCINGWGIEPLPGYLECVRELCSQFGTVLIFDEIITGVRTGLGGIQKKLNVTPDLSLFGKSIGNGIPVTILAGKRRYMSLYEKRKLVHGGTYNGHIIGIAAVRATFISLSQPEVYAQLEKNVDKLKFLILDAAKKSGLDIVIQGGTNCLVLNCNDTPILEYDECTPIVRKKNDLIRQCMRRYGILAAPLLRLYPNIMLDDNDLSFFKQQIYLAFLNARQHIDFLERKNHDV